MTTPALQFTLVILLGISLGLLLSLSIRYKKLRSIADQNSNAAEVLRQRLFLCKKSNGSLSAIIRRRQLEINGLRTTKNQLLESQSRYQRCLQDADEKAAFRPLLLTTSGFVMVVKHCHIDGYKFQNVVKTYKDPDSEFNYAQACELCEILNAD